MLHLPHTSGPVCGYLQYCTLYNSSFLGTEGIFVCGTWQHKWCLLAAAAASDELHMSFRWASYELHMSFRWASYAHQMSFVWASDELQMSFIWASYELQMGFIWASDGLHMSFRWASPRCPGPRGRLVLSRLPAITPCSGAPHTCSMNCVFFTGLSNGGARPVS